VERCPLYRLYRRFRQVHRGRDQLPQPGGVIDVVSAPGATPAGAAHPSGHETEAVGLVGQLARAWEKDLPDFEDLDVL
jgi:hypothetical protein